MLTPAPTIGDTSWYVHDRFGLFIHWGLYALNARHEWCQKLGDLSHEEYARRYYRRFEPDLFEPREWARQAKAAGMKYVVVTAKHHEGFCLWDSAYTDFKATNAPGCRRDLLREIVDAFRAEGLRIGLYYSLIDWQHPDFTLDVMHPLRNHPEAGRMSARRDMRRYAAYMRDQVRELLTGYGPVDVLWLDYSYPHIEHKTPDGVTLPGKGRQDWESRELISMVREISPNTIVNNRLDLPTGCADIHTPEQFQPHEWWHVDGEAVVWEACHTLAGAWGYKHEGGEAKDARQLIGLLIDSVSKGGNLLMNVGPTGRGEFAPDAQDALTSYAQWMHHHGRGIYGCTQSEFTPPTGVLYTQNHQKNRLYAHILHWPFRHLHLPGLAGKVEYAQLLHDTSEVAFLDPDAPTLALNTRVKGAPGALTLELPVAKPPVEVPVVELFLN